MTIETFSSTRPTLATSKADLETPCIVADLDIVDNNLHAMAELANTANVNIRPHTKAHKIPAVARRQEDIYGPGVLCQKLSEAEVLARAGVRDIILVCPVVTKPKLERVFWVNDHLDHFAMVVDSPQNISPLANAAAERDTTINVVLEVDIGCERMGVSTVEEAIEVASFIDAETGVELWGLLAHDNHIPSPEKRVKDYERECGIAASTLEDVIAGLTDNGIPATNVISGASSTAQYMADEPIVTDLDPGRYLFNDVNLLSSRPEITPDDCALTVLTTVISRPTNERAIVDAGLKTLSFTNDPMPLPKSRDDVEFYRASSEHGFIDISNAPDIRVGDRLEFIVQNVYGAINIHDILPGLRDGHVAEVWNVSARGKDQ